jgi:ADP-ribose pyrophosphatase YjhB (NUDIX family)
VSDTKEAVRTGREYPQAPILGVAAVVLRDNDILLIRRGREPLLGAWSLPGGALELGETMAEGVVREIFEETGIRVRAVETVATLDRIVRDDRQRVRFHYVLVEWLCFAEAQQEPPVCGDDAAEARWVPREEISSADYDVGETTLGVIEKALRLAETLER